MPMRRAHGSSVRWARSPRPIISSAVSTNAQAMDKFGIAADHRFTMWDWVGGRYSVWSAIGLIAEIVIGSERFEEFLQGRQRHRQALHDGAVRAKFAGAHGIARRVESHLSWACRRSRCCPTINGSRACRRICSSSRWKATASRCRSRAQHVNFATAPIVWGEPGSNAQHSFFQMLHQGTLTEALGFHRAVARLVGRHRGTGSGAEELLRPVAGVCLRLHAAGSRGGYAQGRRQRRGNRPHRPRIACTKAIARVRC